MRSQKLLIVSAAMVATTTLASVSFADNTTSGSGAPRGTMTTGTTPSSSSTVMTPSTPSVSATSTTQGAMQGGQGGTMGSTPSTGTLPPATPPTASSIPTSTTTTTGADDMPTSTAAAVPATASEPRETTTIYQKRRPNKAYLITGGALLIGTYATTAAFSAANGPVGDKDLFIPVAGPWINLANRDCRGPCTDTDTRDTALIIGSGVLQSVGAALVITSFFVPERDAVARITAGPVKMHIAPTAAMGGGGLGAVGTF